MAKKYNFSVTYPVGEGITETIQVVEGDSFDEVIRIVERGVKERMEVINSRVNKPAQQAPKQPAPTVPPINTQVGTPPASGPASAPSSKTSG